MPLIEMVAMRVKECRAKKKMTQAVLAEKAGINRSYLARLETGRENPTLETLERIADALGVTVASLVK